jgi:hypothetical protein
MSFWDLKEIKFLVIHNGKSLEFTMREMLGSEDQAYVSQYTDSKDGRINTQELWRKRLSRCIVHPAEFQEMLSQGKVPNAVWQELILRWAELNNPDMKAFLGT